MSVILFSTNCPKCKILEKILKEKNINYDYGDIQEIIDKGFCEAPILKVDNNYYSFSDSIKMLRKESL